MMIGKPLTRATSRPTVRSHQAENLGTIQEMVEIRRQEPGLQMAAWVELAQRRLDQTEAALQGMKTIPGLCLRQQWALQRLERRAARAECQTDRLAAIRGGITVLASLPTDELHSAAVGKAAYRLVARSNEEAPTVRRTVLESGIDTLYDVVGIGTNPHVKTELPLQGSPDDPLFMTDLLSLDPDFRGLPQQARRNPPGLPQPLKPSGQPITPRMRALMSTRQEAIIALERANRRDELASRPDLIQDRNYVIQGLREFDDATLLEVLGRAPRVQAGTASLSGPDRVGRWLAWGVSATAWALVPALGLALGQVVGQTTNLASIPDGLEIAGFLGGFLGTVPGVLLSHVAGICWREQVEYAQSQGAKVMRGEPLIISALEASADLPPVQQSGLQFSRQEILQAAAAELAKSQTADEIRERSTHLRLLERAPGANAAEIHDWLLTNKFGQSASLLRAAVDAMLADQSPESKP
ncbi:MAG: hypothetical protein AB7S38_28205 [Vulcanimicrobiota bacterium]